MPSFAIVGNEVETSEPIATFPLRLRPRVLPAEETAGQRTPHHHADARIAAERHDLVLEITADERVVHFRRAELGPAARALNADRLGRHPGRPVGEADVPHLALAYEILERFDRFFDRR